MTSTQTERIAEIGRGAGPAMRSEFDLSDVEWLERQFARAMGQRKSMYEIGFREGARVQAR